MKFEKGLIWIQIRLNWFDLLWMGFDCRSALCRATPPIGGPFLPCPSMSPRRVMTPLPARTHRGWVTADRHRLLVVTQAPLPSFWCLALSEPDPPFNPPHRDAVKSSRSSSGKIFPSAPFPLAKACTTLPSPCLRSTPPLEPTTKDAGSKAAANLHPSELYRPVLPVFDSTAHHIPLPLPVL
jgi:hypothetical protein